MEAARRRSAALVLVTGAAALPALGIEAARLARELANTFWPGPLTLVVRARAFAKGVARSDGALACAARRIPSRVAGARARGGGGRPITATSLIDAGRRRRARARKRRSPARATRMRRCCSSATARRRRRPGKYRRRSHRREADRAALGCARRDVLDPLLRGPWHDRRPSVSRVALRPGARCPRSRRGAALRRDRARRASGLLDRDPHNAIRLELTRDAADEARRLPRGRADARRMAAGRRAAARRASRRVRAAPALHGADGSEHMRDGFFALLHLEDYARRIVRPHERTLSGPKRIASTLARTAPTCRASSCSTKTRSARSMHCSPPGSTPARRGGARRGGVEHRLVPSPMRTARRPARFLADRPVVIATATTATRRRWRTATNGAPGGGKQRTPPSSSHSATSRTPMHRHAAAADPPRGTRSAGAGRRAGLRDCPVGRSSAYRFRVSMRCPRCSRAISRRSRSPRLRRRRRLGRRARLLAPRAAGDDLSIRVLHKEVLQASSVSTTPRCATARWCSEARARSGARRARRPRQRRALPEPARAEDVFRSRRPARSCRRSPLFFTRSCRRPGLPAARRADFA